MPRFVHKATGMHIEARRWDGSIESADEIERWSGGVTKAQPLPVGFATRLILQIQRPDMTLNVAPDDWVARSGDLYMATTHKEILNDFEEVSS